MGAGERPAARHRPGAEPGRSAAAPAALREVPVPLPLDAPYPGAALRPESPPRAPALRPLVRPSLRSLLLVVDAGADPVGLPDHRVAGDLGAGLAFLLVD